MNGSNGTLFVSGYGEEQVEPDECKVRVTITSERATAMEAQKPARVHLSWRTIRHPEDRKYAMLRTPKYSVYAYLSEAEQDEIVLDENGIDTRKLLIGFDRDKVKQGARSIEAS